MTKEEQIQFIRQKAVEANPDIKKLDTGCMVKRYYDEFDGSHEEKLMFLNKDFHGNMIFYREISQSVSNEYCIYFEDRGWDLDESGIEIIGRDIRLADILFTIEKSQIDIEISLYQNRCHIGRYSEKNKQGYYSYCLYDLLKDNIDEQSEECIEFIYNLLK